MSAINAPALEAGKKRAKILFITPHLRWPLISGSLIRKSNVLQGLLSAGAVDVLACGGDESVAAVGPYMNCGKVMALPAAYFNTTDEQKTRYGTTPGRLWLAFASRAPFTVMWGNATAARTAVQQMVSWNDYSLVWVETLRIGTILDVPRFAKNVTTILDGDDFDWMREWGMLRSTPSYGAKILDYADLVKTWFWERSCGRHYSCVIRCSQQDAAYQGGNNVAVIANGTDCPDDISRSPECRILFVGNLTYPPNRFGVEWFLSNVWPLVRQKVPSACLDIVGIGPSDGILSANGRAGVVVHGFVEDLVEFYRRASLSIVPLHAGGGTRLKILESLARSVPVVSTDMGAYGIPLHETHGILRVNDVEKFADACAAVLREPDCGLQRAAERGREFVRTHFDWKHVREAVANLAGKWRESSERAVSVES